MFDLKLAIVREYSDVFARSSTSTDESVAEKLILQVKSEEWEGLFVDLKDGNVPDKSVLRNVEDHTHKVSVAFMFNIAT